VTPEGWIVNLAAVIGAVFAGYQANGSKHEAKRARELSEPTGNGFATAVLDKLNRVEAKLDEHIHDHAVDAFDRNKREKKLDADLAERDRKAKR
jgi:hypothetical protein